MINKLKYNLKENKLTVGSWITIGNLSVAEIMADTGFDWLVVDMEHSAIDYQMCQNLIMAIEGKGCVPLVRVGANDPLIIKRVMDSGAYGVIVPMVNTQEDAIKAVNAVKYPPIGTRGVGLARAQGYGYGFEEYANTINENSIVIVQIEHIEAIENLDVILNTPGVDGSIIGPYDLSGSLGCPGKFEKTEVKNAIIHYEKVCKRLKKPMGFHIIKTDIKTVNYYKKRGYAFLAVGLDTLYLGNKCREIIRSL